MASLLRKLRRSTQRADNEDHRERDLGLSHLKKLFAEFRNPPPNTSLSVQDQSLYSMMPLFNRVFENIPGSEFVTRFPEVDQFASHVSKLLVNEIRKRATNQSTGNACLAIIDYLEIGHTQSQSKGWQLMSCIDILAAGPASVIDCMSAGYLPSTMVKCIYLFFDLPPVNTGEGTGDLSPAQSRTVLQKIFEQILTKLCSHVGPCEELSRSDDLHLLFNAVSSTCPVYNRMWRKTAQEVLTTISRSGLTSNVIKYINDKRCISECIDCLNSMSDTANSELSPMEKLEIFMTVFCFLKESCHVTTVLLNEFQTSDGYIILIDFLLQTEDDLQDESVQIFRNLVLLIGQLATCGKIDKVKTLETNSLYRLPGFSTPKPLGSGVTICNINGYKVLHNVFIKCKSVSICTVILEVISNLLHQDTSNYFILEPYCSLSEFAEKIHTKPTQIQERYFELIEFIVTSLSFVPCKELVSLSLLLKANLCNSCCILCMKTLIRVVDYHEIFKKVFREVGILEVLITCLHRFTTAIKENSPDAYGSGIEEDIQELGFQVMDCLTTLLTDSSGSSAEASYNWSRDVYHMTVNEEVFRQCGGARCAHNLVPYAFCRNSALSLVKQLLLSTHGEDDMGTLLCLLQKEPSAATDLKISILEVMVSAMKESHRARAVFRKVNGFVYVMSVFVSMEQCLKSNPPLPWDAVNRIHPMTVIQMIFCTLTIAMRYEPANVKFFRNEVQYTNLLHAIKLLGCFSETDTLPDFTDSNDNLVSTDPVFKEYFQDSTRLQQFTVIPTGVDPVLIYACFLFRCLYDMATDSWDRLRKRRLPEAGAAYKRTRSVCVITDRAPLTSRKSWGGTTRQLAVPAGTPAPIIIHAGAVVLMLELITSVDQSTDTALSRALQLHVVGVLRHLLELERNQQIMCNEGLVRKIFMHCAPALLYDKYYLHNDMQTMFELMASQSLTANDLRDYLRLGDPLCCNPADSPVSEGGGLVPVDRVRCLVTMTTPRDLSLPGAAVTPPFTELNMAAEGYGCLFLPSIAPQGSANPSVFGESGGSGNDDIVGGMGTGGERIFPPSAGLTYTTWCCVEKQSKDHPVRLLQIVRKLVDQSDSYLCLSVSIDCNDKVMLISTQETPLPKPGSEITVTPPAPSDSVARIWNPILAQEGAWQHIALVFQKAGMFENSSVTLYINSRLVSTNKLHYISPNIGATKTSSSISPTSVSAYIGTPPHLRQVSNLIWKQGPSILLEEAVNQATVDKIYQLGPNYAGCLQAISNDEYGTMASLVAEDRVVFSLSAKSINLMTVKKIKNLYNRNDGRAVASQLSVAQQENPTPVYVLHNAAGHLTGSARTLGATLIGFTGVHTFHPQPVSQVLNNVGGMAILLGFVAMSADVEGLYASVKALVCVLKSTRAAQTEMHRISGFQLLAMILKKKQSLLNGHILHLTFSLVGTIDSNREVTVIPNKIAFNDLLCDLEVWHDAPGELQKSLYEHFYELLVDASGSEINCAIMRQAQLIKKILFVMKDTSLSKNTLIVLCQVLKVLLYLNPEKKELLRFGQFVISTLPETTLTEDQMTSEAEVSQVHTYNITLRNSCLEIFNNLMSTNKPHTDPWWQDMIVNTLGLDWLVLFTQRHLHQSTVILASHILMYILANADCLNRFKDGVTFGGWSDNSQQITEEQSARGLSLDGNRQAVVQKSNRKMCQIPGFICIQWQYQSHCILSQLYYMMTSLLVNQPINAQYYDQPLTLDNLCLVVNDINDKKHKHDAAWCLEAAVVLLNMVKTTVNMPWQIEYEGSWMRDYPVTIIQLLAYLHRKFTNHFTPISMSADFLTTLASSLFQQKNKTDRNSPCSESDRLETSVGVDRSESLTRSDSLIEQTSLLSNHPVKHYVIELIMKIVLDSFCLPPSKSTQVVDIVLNTCPEGSTQSESAEFQTEILRLIMNHLLKVDILLGDQAVIQLSSSSHYSNVVAHVFYFSNLVVDKLWQGCYNKEAKEIFEFVKELIAQGKRRASGLNLESLYNCLNRTILFELSQSITCLSYRTSVLDALHRLTANKSLIFGPGNYDMEFIGCLTYCLLDLTHSPHGVNREDSQTQWHINPSEITDSETSREALQLLKSAANRVWQELYVHKKPAIEEALKVGLQVPSASTTVNISTPDLNDLREVLSAPAHKAWITFYEAQKRTTSSKDVERFHALISSRLERVSTGVLKMAGKKSHREIPAMKQSAIPHDDYIRWMCKHVSQVRDLINQQMTDYSLDNAHSHEFIHTEWLKLERELLRERGIWGPVTASPLDKYRLDMTEGPHRMRLKMERNDSFYKNYPYRAVEQSRASKHKPPVSRDSEIYYRKSRITSLIEDDNGSLVSQLSINQSFEMNEDEAPEQTVLNAPRLLPRQIRPPTADSDADTSEHSQSVDLDEPSQEQSPSDEPTLTSEEQKTSLDNHQTLLRLLDDNEKIGPMFRCARIQGLDSYEGIILLGKERFYILDGFTLKNDNQILDIDSLSEDEKDPIIPKVQHYTSQTKTVTTTKKTCNKFLYDDIREVLKRRYLLQPIALEIFNSDGRNILLAFHQNIRNKVITKLNSQAAGLTSNSQQSVAGQKQTTKMEQSSGLSFSSLMSERSVTSRWERGEISNFQYLMHLNTLAGRSYNDLMQYPVFPWILADYTSETLDLTRDETFRDLSKPMGAQTPVRLTQFQKRYKEWDDPTGETPPYHYGTHYSSAMIVASYLVRMEPFTQHFLGLQGGHFDLADRMFHTVKEAYESAAKNNMADVKELIPEFFYLPDFLNNANKFDLGEKQNGTRLNNVGLPVWAKGDAKEFIRQHREALECDYVSSRLHQWIDLIFGFKQQGSAAMEASNVFHYLFYEGNVDIYSIDDPLKRNAIIGFINNFGQIPKQLFKKPHPQKKTRTDSPSFFFLKPDCLYPNKNPIKELAGPVGQIICTDKNILAVEQNKVLIPPSYNRYIAWGFSDLSIRICPYDSEKAASVFEQLDSADIMCACSPDKRTIITAGSSTVVSVWSITEGRGSKTRAVLKKPLFGHTAAVLCMAVSSQFNIIVTGCRDKSCIIWDLIRLQYTAQLPDHVAPVSAITINELDGNIATCASSWLYLWTVNGEQLAACNTAISSPLQINCVAMSQANSWDKENVILTGANDGVVRMWQLEYVKQNTNTSKDTDYKQIPPTKSSHTPPTQSSVEERSSPNWLTPTSSLDKSSNSIESLSKSSDYPQPLPRRSLSIHSVDTGESPSQTPSTLQKTPSPAVRRRNLNRWKRVLICKSKLTMHTSFERRDNKEPSEITAVACSRDHQTVFVGDAKGRVFSWILSDETGPADHWVKDEQQSVCTGCDVKFTTTNRRHHCRNCGHLFCSRCSKYEIEIPRLGIMKPTRVCLTCFNTLNKLKIESTKS